MDAVVAGLIGVVVGTGLAYLKDEAAHSRARRDAREDRRYKERREAYLAFIKSAHAAQTAATTIARSGARFEDIYMTYDGDMANNLREVQLVGPDGLYRKAKAVAGAVWDFRDALTSDPPIVFSRSPESEYEILRQRFVTRRDEFIEAANTTLRMADS